jgi:hypothetical protein
MKIQFIRLLVSAAATLAFAVISPQLSPLRAQGTAFTYQGQLVTSNGPAHGVYNFTFALYNASSGGSQFGSTITSSGVAVSNGLFTVTVDFGSGIFNGTAYWLQIGVETNGALLFTALTGRQQLTPAPYAIYSEGGNAAGLTGTIPSGDLSGAYSGVIDLNNAGNSFSGNGSGLTGVNAAFLDGFTPANFWQTTGNAGTTPGVNFVGTTDGKALELNPGGTVGVGTATPGGRLDVEGRTSDADSIYVLNGYPNGNAIFINATNGSDAYAIWAFSSGPGVVVNSTEQGLFASSSAADGVDANASAVNAIGVSGSHTASSGTAAGVQGATYSTSGFANGVYGVVESANPGGNSSGVMGQNNGTNYNGIGVYGSQNGSGYGVYGYTPSGYAVIGYSPSGYGVEGESGTGIGVYGYSSSDIAVYGYSGSSLGLYGYSGSSYGGEIGSDLNTGLYAYSYGADAIDAYTYSSNSIGIYGEHSESGGTAAGVEGLTYSQDGDARGVFGVVESTTPGGFSTAVWGQNNGTSGAGIGVYGTQNGSGLGVYGYTPSGIGVLAQSSSGTGVYGESSTGAGVYAYSGSGSALTIGNGAIHVSGASTNSTSTAAFTQVATPANIVGDTTLINNSLCNGDPNAILIVTPNWNPHGGPAYYWSHTVGVYYTGTQWAIFNEDSTAMPAGPAFNVLIIKN